MPAIVFNDKERVPIRPHHFTLFYHHPHPLRLPNIKEEKIKQESKDEIVMRQTNAKAQMKKLNGCKPKTLR
ncbi:hypothetical protein M0802_000399 [Mischocyttarus mexicanus]|nr:hypothetical protein M0802_000399 [Mischocyttarus mexicanus]